MPEILREFIATLETPGPLCLLTVGGSRAYGMADVDSDWDLRGFFMTPTDWLLGLPDSSHNHTFMSSRTLEREGHPPVKVDLVLYSFQKFCSLLRTGNPMALETLWSHHPYALVGQTGSALLGLRKELLTERAARAFFGAAGSMIDRVLEQKDWSQPMSRKRAKEAAHALRNARMGSEVVEGKDLCVYRPDHDYLKSVRDGKVAIREVADGYRACRAARADALSPLPNGDEASRLIEEFVRETHLWAVTRGIPDVRSMIAK